MRKNHLANILCGVLLLLTDSVASDTNPSEAKAIRKVVQRLNDMTLVAGHFEQTKHLQGLAVPLQSKGEFVFWKGQGLYLVTREPFYNATTITVERIIHWREDGSGALAEEASGLVQREISRTLLAFLSADLELIEERFLTQWRFRQDRWELTLAPRQDLVRKQMRSVTLRGADFIRQLNVIAANGDVTEMTFKAVHSQDAPSAEQCQYFFLNDAASSCRRFQPPVSP